MDPLVLNVLERFICGDRVSSSPRIPSSTWSGGCYKSKGEAEKRLREIEYFKHKSAAIKLAVRKAMLRP